MNPDIPSKNEQTQPLGTVIELNNLPPGPPEDDMDGNALGNWLVAFVKDFFDNVQIVIDLGTERGVKTGDYFAVLYGQKRVTSLDGKELGNIPVEGALIRTVQTYPRFSVCQLESYPYKLHFDMLPDLIEDLEEEDGTIDLERHRDVLGPVVKGQSVVRISPDEKASRDQIEDLYGRTLDDSTSQEERNFYYREMVRKADAFLLDYSNGYFASEALFQKGYAQFQLKEYQNTIDTFNFFLNKYPFSVSADGARDWIEKARQVLKDEKAAQEQPAAGAPRAPQAASTAGSRSPGEELSALIERYGERYSAAVIVLAFAIASLVVAAILFGILSSTGIMKLVLPGAVREAEFGGAMAGFLITFLLLVRSYRQVSSGTPLNLTGNVLTANGEPVEGAQVFVLGVDRQKTTDHTGWFQIEVNKQKSWVVRATFQDKSASVEVPRNQAGQRVELRLGN